jgi:hypothetical protein
VLKLELTLPVTSAVEKGYDDMQKVSKLYRKKIPHHDKSHWTYMKGLRANNSTLPLEELDV